MTIQQMKDFKELQELRDYYWEESYNDLLKEVEEEIKKKSKWFGLKKFFGINLEEIETLHSEKFEEFFKKMKDALPKQGVKNE